MDPPVLVFVAGHLTLIDEATTWSWNVRATNIEWWSAVPEEWWYQLHCFKGLEPCIL